MTLIQIFENKYSPSLAHSYYKKPSQFHNMIRRSLTRQSRQLQLKTQLSPPSSRIFALQTLPSISAPSSSLKYFSNSRTPFRPAAAEATSESPDASSNPPPSEPKAEEDPLKKELEEKNREVIELKDKYLRSVADFRNLQDRSQRDQAQTRDFAISRFAKDLLESIDNLDRALTTVPPESVGKDDGDKDLENLYNGLKMTDTVLMQTLKKHGLERFDPAENEEKFNPNIHEATFQTPIEGKEDGTVFMTQQKGFMLNGRVIRVCVPFLLEVAIY